MSSRSASQVEGAVPGRPSRRLICIPIIHSQTDLGSLAASIRHLYVRRKGQSEWNRHTRRVADAWMKIRKALAGAKLANDQVKVYQDGLPNCGHELQIVKDLAEAGSPNHEIVLELVEKGATLVGTESPELLMEEYNLAQQTLADLSASPDGAPTDRRQEQSALLLEKRDRYIAARVNETLQPGETGVIFLGMLHALERHLPPDIQVRKQSYWP